MNIASMPLLARTRRNVAIPWLAYSGRTRQPFTGRCSGRNIQQLQCEVAMWQELLAKWEAYEDRTEPPSEAMQLWNKQRRVVYIDENWGPAVPYPAVDHRDGTENYGYVSLKKKPAAIAQVPETEGWPELAKILEIINAPDSPLESVGCEKSFFPVEGRGDATVNLGSYVDIVFTEFALNEEPTNLLRLAAALMPALDGCEKWWGSAEMGLQRYRGLQGCTRPWGLMMRVNNYGRSKEEARRDWGVSLSRLGNAISQLPQDFPRGHS